MIKPSTMMGKGEMIYTYYDDDTKDVYCFAVTRIMKEVKHLLAGMDKNGPHPHLSCIMAPIDPEQAQWFREKGGIEQRRLDRLTREMLIDGEPLLLAHRSDNKLIMIDGAHRYVKAADLKIRELLAYVVKAPIWVKYLVDLSEYEPNRKKLHEAVRKMNSGIK